MISVELVAPTTGTQLPTGDTWAHEPKWDGYRVAVIVVGEVQIVSRRGTDLTEVFPDPTGARHYRSPRTPPTTTRCGVDGIPSPDGNRGHHLQAAQQPVRQPGRLGQDQVPRNPLRRHRRNHRPTAPTRGTDHRHPPHKGAGSGDPPADLTGEPAVELRVLGRTTPLHPSDTERRTGKRSPTTPSGSGS